MTTDPVHEEDAEMTGPDTTMNVDAAIELWASVLKKTSQTYKEDHEQDVAAA